jgi:hypothetical protein
MAPTEDGGFRRLHGCDTDRVSEAPLWPHSPLAKVMGRHFKGKTFRHRWPRRSSSIKESCHKRGTHFEGRSHEEMITKNTIGTDSASCAKACVRRGGEWVLRPGDDVSRLKNRAGIENFAAQKVQITGTLDTKTNTIENTGIEVLKSKAASR